jgi:hypothetical protein
MLMASFTIASAFAAVDVAAIAPFSTASAGASLPAGWRVVTLRGVKPAEIALVSDANATVLRIRSKGAAGSAAHPIANAAANTELRWRWKIDRVVEKADLAQRAGDDFSARLYVFFAVPLEELSFFERMKLRIARAIYGPDVPAAGICYVWDNLHAPGTVVPNPYASRIRTFVLQSGSARAGEWTAERRDLEADFLAAFGPRGSPVPPVSGIAAGNDTDQTGESATAWFGDISLGARS